MKALLLGVALMALAPNVAAAAQDRLALRLYLTRETDEAPRWVPSHNLKDEEIAAAQKCLDDVRRGERFPHMPVGRIDQPSHDYPPGLADAAEMVSDCLHARGMGGIAVRPSMSIITPHLLQ
jgi:hypothetical protein